MFKNKLQLLLIGILLAAGLLRLYKLADYPVNLTPDEASLGYNAYSILQTGRDEYGTFMPLTFKSFGDHKPGLYVYLTVPFVALLGLNEWAVRLPSALMGVLAVWMVFKIASLAVNKGKNEQGGASWFPYIAAFTLAISPWSINFSRGAWETNVSLTFTLLGIYSFLSYLYSVNETNPNSSFLRNGMQLAFSAVFFGLTFWTYQGAKLSTILVLFALVIAYSSQLWNQFKTNFKQFLVPSSLFLVLLAPIIYGMFTGTGGRLEVFSIFSYERPQKYIEETILEPAKIPQRSLTYKLFHSEPLNFARAILHRYFHYFSGRFLAFEGDWSHPQLTAPYTGVLHWPELITLSVGFLWVGSMIMQGWSTHLASSRRRPGSMDRVIPNSKETHKAFNLNPTMDPAVQRDDEIPQSSTLPQTFLTFILLWLFLAPLPAALSRDEVNAVRSLNLVIPLVFLISFGWYQIIGFFQNKNFNLFRVPNFEFRISHALFFCSSILLLYALVFYLDSYYFIAPHKTAHLGQGYGYKQVVQTVQSVRRAGKTVVLSESYDQPYIYFLFCEKYDPARYQQNAFIKEGAYGDVGLIPQVDEKLKFKMINWSADQFESGSVFVGNPVTTIHPETSSDPARFRVLGTINYPNNHPAFRIVEVF